MRNADMVVYHAPTHTGVSQKPNQHALRMFISMEQPNMRNFLQRTDYLENNFDLISTYSMANTYPEYESAQFAHHVFSFKYFKPLKPYFSQVEHLRTRMGMELM